jgi:threonine/homoserine/homoserine lactone efflux protein
MVYLRFALTGMNFIVQHRLWFVALGWVTVVLFLVLGILAFAAANKQQDGKKSLLLKNNMDRFLLGLMMSALNPVQIPFWVLWTSTFIQAKLLAGNTHRFQPVHSGRRYQARLQDWQFISMAETGS